MTTPMGRLLPVTKADDGVDYGPLLGFGAPAVRVDPHTHVAPRPTETSLREMADIIREKKDLQGPLLNP